MTPAVVSMGLLKVHLMVAVEGHLFQKWFHASPNLAYTYIWDKTDAYGQRVYGLSEAVGEWKGWMEDYVRGLELFSQSFRNFTSTTGYDRGSEC